MRIATLFFLVSKGGLNYVFRLLNALSDINDVKIDIYTYKHLEFVLSEQSSDKIKIRFLKPVQQKIYRIKKKAGFIDDLKNIAKIILNKTQSYLNKSVIDSNKRMFEFIEKNYDLVFYPWPYYSPPLDIRLPLFFVPHDITHSHFFGFSAYNVYNQKNCNDMLIRLSQYWLKGGNAIVSSSFIKYELSRFFSDFKNKIEVVYISTLNTILKLNDEEIKNVLEKYDIRNEYILWGNNQMQHKNNSQLIGAYFYVKSRYNDIKLVMTGIGTEGIRLKSNNHYYADFIVEKNQEWDIIGLGELSTYDFTAILQAAKLVINTSLCEAGNGSGLDAWTCGIPVAQSDIPSFNEQLDFLNVRAEVFDPRNDKSISEAILRLIENPELVKANTSVSMDAMKKYSWDKVAQQYYSIFKNKLTS